MTPSAEHGIGAGVGNDPGPARSVAHVLSMIDPAGGGPPAAILGLAPAQVAAGLSVSVVAAHRPEEDLRISESIAAAGVSVRLVGPGRGPLVSHPTLRGVIHEVAEQSDVLHLHGLWESAQHFAARWAQQRDRPYLIRPCGMLDPWSLRQSRWKKRLYLAWRLRTNLNRATAIHYTTEAERDLAAQMGVRAPAIVEPNGVRLEEFEHLPEPGTFRRAFAAVGDRPIVVLVGRLHPVKGLDLVIPAFARAERGEAVLVLAGPCDPAYRRQVEAMIRAAGLDEHDVVLTGMLHGPERVAALTDAALFVLPSYHENFGIAVVEALAAGTPVIVSDQVAIHRTITDEGVGGVVPTEVEPLAAAITRWLAEPAMRRDAAGRARPMVWQRYDWKQIARRWAGHYARLCGAEAPAVEGEAAA